MHASHMIGSGTKGHIVQQNCSLSFNFSKIGIAFDIFASIFYSPPPHSILFNKIVRQVGFAPMAVGKNKGRKSREKKKWMFAVGEELGLTEGPNKTKIFVKDTISS